MRTRYLVSMLIGIAITCACQDNDDSGSIDLRPEHKMRVKEIVGYNSHWKDYTLKISYANDKIIDIERFNLNGRKVGGLEIRREQESVSYMLQDYIPAIDADSISRLDARLQKLYGKGNYSLEDSIPLTPTVLMMLTTESSDGIITAQQFTYYQSPTDFGTGVNFSPRYNIKNRESYVYEYDENNCILICRNLSDVFDGGNEQSYDRIAYKTDYNIVGSQVQKSLLFLAGSEYENNWNLQNEYVYTYSAGNLIGIVGDNYSLRCDYKNNYLSSITENDKVTFYTMNEQGYCIRIEEASGDYMDIEYENGSGDFNIFTRLDRPQQGFPIIW